MARVEVQRACCWWDFFFQAEDGIRDAQESRGLGDVYKRQAPDDPVQPAQGEEEGMPGQHQVGPDIEGDKCGQSLSLIHI